MLVCACICINYEFISFVYLLIIMDSCPAPTVSPTSKNNKKKRKNSPESSNRKARLLDAWKVLDNSGNNSEKTNIDKWLACSDEEFEAYLSKLDAQIRLVQLKHKVSQDYKTSLQQSYQLVKQIHWMFQLPCTSCTSYAQCICSRPDNNYKTLCLEDATNDKHNWSINLENQQFQELEQAYALFKQDEKNNYLYRHPTMGRINFKTMQYCKHSNSRWLIEPEEPVAHPNVLMVVRQELNQFHCPRNRLMTVLPIFDALTKTSDTMIKEHNMTNSSTVKLNESEEEYQLVAHHFLNDVGNKQLRNSMIVAYPKTKIKSIERVFNPFQARLYELEKESMRRKHGQVSERMLWHGTGVNHARTVALNSLDLAYSNGGYFGAGIYCSTSPYFIQNGYAHEDDQGNSVMLFCKVLVGRPLYRDMTSSTATVRPELKNTDGEMCDSICALHDNDSSEMQIVYKNSQCFVGYIVTYN